MPYPFPIAALRFGRPVSDDVSLTRTSLCGKFKIVKLPKDRTVAWTHVTSTLHYGALENNVVNLGYFRTMKEAIKACEQAVEERNKVWHYFHERAERDIAHAKELACDPEKMAKVADYIKMSVPQTLSKTVDQVATDLYTYQKHRAKLMTNPPFPRPIDPECRRDWSEMLFGTYVQWWNRPKAV